MIEIDEIAGIFTKIDDKDAMKAFFGEIFTPAERKDLALRWELMKLVNEKVPQREIASRLGISLCKITRGAKVLKNADSVTVKMIKESNRE
jgi:TrpR family trp operon transcriptional repressor